MVKERKRTKKSKIDLCEDGFYGIRGFVGGNEGFGALVGGTFDGRGRFLEIMDEIFDFSICLWLFSLNHLFSKDRLTSFLITITGVLFKDRGDFWR